MSTSSQVQSDSGCTKVLVCTPHKHGVPASRLTELYARWTELIARRTSFGIATATKEKLHTLCLLILKIFSI